MPSGQKSQDKNDEGRAIGSEYPIGFLLGNKVKTKMMKDVPLGKKVKMKMMRDVPSGQKIKLGSTWKKSQNDEGHAIRSKMVIGFLMGKTK